MTAGSLASYADDLFNVEDALLRGFREEAFAQGLPPIQVPGELARILQVLIVQSSARTILEVGTLFGYSSIIMARVLPPGGHITSLEVNPKHVALARSNLQAAGVADRVTIVEGPAVRSLTALSGRNFDFVFIDADKSSYPEYLEHALALTHAGSTIVADNVWRGGRVDHPEPSDVDAVGASRYNRMLAENPRLLTALIPTRDGADGAAVSVVLP